MSHQQLLQKEAESSDDHLNDSHEAAQRQGGHRQLSEKQKAFMQQIHIVMGLTSLMLVLGLAFTSYKLGMSIYEGDSFKNKDYAILAISLCIWIWHIWQLNTNLTANKTNQVKRILEIFKYLLVFFVLIMSFVMSRKSWYDTIQSCAFAAQFCLIWMLEIFYQQSHKLKDHGIIIK